MIEEKFFWQRFVVFFVCGAVLGAAVALKWQPISWHIVLAIAVAVGLVSALAGDRFWWALGGKWM